MPRAFRPLPVQGSIFQIFLKVIAQRTSSGLKRQPQ
jgi:hypothetical protein